MDNIAVSACSNPEMTPAEALAAYSALGYRKYELFIGSGDRRRPRDFDMERDPAYYLELGRRHGIQFSSAQLPPVEDDIDGSVNRAIRASRFAEALAASVVVFKSRVLANLVQAAGPFLDGVDDLALVPVISNHSGRGSSIRTLEDYRHAIEGINDPRMKTLLEVGHFHSVGVSWKEGYDLLGDSVALVHFKDQVGSRSVPFGEGEIDLPGLFRRMRSVGYSGDCVVEMEVEDRENTLRYLADAVDYLRRYCLEDDR